ncbi:unnamed protein product [Ectocarpus sp. CCAP 1310/34]|nr:unnamed protein product [Ectocarpus sp. CCAP 1310/34]
MRVRCSVLLVLGSARGLVANERCETLSLRLRQAQTPPHGHNEGAPLAWQNRGLTRAALCCRGGSTAAASTLAAAATATGGERRGGGSCLGKQSTGKGVAKKGWGQLGRASSSNELVSRRGGENVASSADVAKQAYRTALLRTALLVCSAGAFGMGTWVVKGKTSALEFFAGYIVEQSLSVDNLFIFIMLFDYFKVPAEFQSRVLNWGIIGAVSMRAIMIVVGVAAIQRFRGVMLVFAGILVVSSLKLLMEGVEEDHADSSALEGNMVLRVANWMMDSTDYYDGEKFFTLVDGAKKATPLLLCLICIEMTDFVFAVDSIPAVLAISQDTFIVYASNVFAICAMRSIYTLVSHAISDLPYLKPAVALVLGFVGGKMFAEFFHYEIGVGTSLSVVCGLLAIGVIASVISNKRRDAALAAADASAVTGGGSSGLTFESFSAENDGREGGGGGRGFAGAAAAAFASEAGGEESTPPAVSAMQLAGVQDKAIAASKAADAAVATAGDAADDAAAAAEAAGATALAEGAAPVKRGLVKGAAFGMEPARKVGGDAEKQGFSDGVAEGMDGEGKDDA